MHKLKYLMNNILILQFLYLFLVLDPEVHMEMFLATLLLPHCKVLL